METSAVFGHVGSICVLDPTTAPEPLTLERLTAMIESRLHLLPPFRRRLVTVPLGLDQPYWIEDPGFDIEYHVRELALAAPGDDKQLAEQAARLHARPLDRSRPLWELYLIHGLQGGRMAVYSKVHHAAIDGVSGSELLTAVLDVTPEGRTVEQVPWQPERDPAVLEVLARSALSLAGHPLRAARLTYGVLRSVPTLAMSLRREKDVVLPSPGLRAPATPFNKAISPHRRWAFRTLPLEDFKAVKNAHGGTVNDVVMALSTGALR